MDFVRFFRLKKFDISILMGGEGVEPSTSSLSEKRSTAELATPNYCVTIVIM